MKTSEEETILNVRNVLKRHWMIEELVRKQNLVELQRLIEQFDCNTIVQILEDFSHDDRQVVWNLIEGERREEIRVGLNKRHKSFIEF